MKSLSGFSKENESGGKNDSTGDSTKKLDANSTKAEPPKKPTPMAVTIKVEKDDSAGDPIAELSNLLPPNLMKEITSGHPSKQLLEKVADLLPANVLKQAVAYLQTAATETVESQQVVQLPGASGDAASKAKADEEKSKKAGKPTEAPSRVQVIQPRKGLPNPAVPASTNAKGPVAGSSAKTPIDNAGINKQPVVKPALQSKAVPSKRNYNDIDPTKVRIAGLL